MRARLGLEQQKAPARSALASVACATKTHRTRREAAISRMVFESPTRRSLPQRCLRFTAALATLAYLAGVFALFIGMRAVGERDALINLALFVPPLAWL